MEYIKPDQYYIDLYDLATIERCLRCENFYTDQDFAKVKKGKINKQSLTEITLYYTKGERYRNKAERIREWKENDRQTQEKFDSASEPQGIYCPNCAEAMHVTIKTPEDYLDKPFRVLFFFECPNCKKRRAIYDNGQELFPKPKLCPKCSKELKTTDTKSGRVYTTISKCSSCNFTETVVDDFEKSSAEWEKKKAEDRKLLAKYREKYCLSDSDGSQYVNHVRDLENFNELFNKNHSKKVDPAYQKAVQAKKLTIVELEKLLNKILEPEKYTKLSFNKPEMEKFVIVPFTVQDADPNRKEYDSKHILQKLLKKALETTNWRLMSEGTSYRMGYVYGRLKGYEREEDLAELHGWKKDAPKSKAGSGLPFSLEFDLDDPKKRGYEY
jgi:hypothetical protein